MNDVNEFEQTGEKFDLNRFFEAARSCKFVVHEVASLVKKGMTEKECQALVKSEFKKVGIVKFWHPTKFRIGTDTVKNFREPADQSIVISDQEIFSIDVGPVIEDHEADFGQTFVFNSEGAENSFQRLADDSILVFNETAKHWREHKVSGRQLYDFAKACAEKLGYRLNLFMNGHRLGDFPHALYSKKHLGHLQNTPTENLWVLEIHLLDERTGRGSFYEDILRR